MQIVVAGGALERRRIPAEGLCTAAQIGPTGVRLVFTSRWEVDTRSGRPHWGNCREQL